MRCHHWDAGCHGYGWHGGCGHGYGPARGPDAPFEAEAPYAYGRRRGRPVSRATEQERLEAYLESLRDEVRGVEQDLRDLRGGGEEPASPSA